jgi:hypothetical protein
LAFKLDVRLKSGRVASRAEPLLIEHPTTIEPAQDEDAATLLAQTLNLARNFFRPARGHVGVGHSSKPSVSSSA